MRMTRASVIAKSTELGEGCWASKEARDAGNLGLVWVVTEGLAPRASEGLEDGQG